jgi:hypothetical protein
MVALKKADWFSGTEWMVSGHTSVWSSVKKVIRIGIICRTHIRLELREVGGDPLEDVVDTDRNYNDDIYQDFYYMRIRIMSFPYAVKCK